MEVQASTRYEAGKLRQLLFGRDYRELWAAPIRVPLLDFDTVAGGLTVVERGGGQQTRALRLRGMDGHEYNFRSVDKWVTPDPRRDLENTPLEAIIQDQVSSLHPAAAIVATGLLDAVGILNPAPRLVVMPDDPRLGEHREAFAGLLGTFEAHADASEDGSSVFADAEEIVDETDFFAALREDPTNRVDARTLLAERLMSVLMADWDRHAGQYRWARFDSAGLHVWTPIPEDRDYAFADYDGLVFALVSGLVPKASPFRERYASNLQGLLQNAVELDHRLIAELSWPEWEEITKRLQADLSDEAIEAAVERMPEPYLERNGPELVRILRARRDALDEVARRIYLELAREAEVHTTDVPERAEIARRPDGSVRVLVTAESDPVDLPPLFDRTYLPSETREIRVYLYGGDDRAIVQGTADGGPLVRVVGGAGDDTLLDRSSVRGRSMRTAFHDDEGENAIETGSEAIADLTAFEPPLWVPGEILPPREWGAEFSWFSPWAGWEHVQGLLIGGGPSWTWYGFRRYPEAGRTRITGMWGTETGRVGVDAEASFQGIGSAPDVWLHGRASQLEDFRFHGFGNDSPDEDELDGEVLLLEQLLVEARLRYPVGERFSLGIGPVFERLDPRSGSGTEPHFPAGAGEAYGKAGLAGELVLEAPDTVLTGGGGFSLVLDARFFPRAWDLTSPFGRVQGTAGAYLPLPARSVVALRVGAAQLWGDAPLPEQVSLGGSATVRGFHYQRFTGDALLHGSVELRSALTRAELFVRGDLGALAFIDLGRVYVDGDSPGGWHRGRGLGLWFRSAGQVVSVTYARGETDRLYLQLGFPW